MHCRLHHIGGAEGVRLSTGGLPVGDGERQPVRFALKLRVGRWAVRRDGVP